MGNYNKQALSDYYQSASWAEKRNKRLKIDGYRCAKCGFTRALEVHHINYERVFHEDVSKDLITLCKKCHNEIELQKKNINPFQVPVEHHTVYFAGKISKNDWRRYHKSSNPEDIVNCSEYGINEQLSTTGPFFIACDHGCYHGEGQHGVGARFGGCMGDYFTREDVLEICKSQIDKAEILFAYINCRDCYGTIAEIGYAHAIGKDIIIYFANTKLQEEMWFIDKMQRNTGVASSKWIEKNLLSHFRRVKNEAV